MDLVEDIARASSSDSHPGPTVSAVVVTYHTGRYLEDCLASLESEPEIREIILVDNGSDASTVAWLEARAAESPKLERVFPGRNIGFAAGCNLGASSAQGDVIALVNPDVIVPPGTFAAVLAILRERPDAWLCGGRLLNMDGSEQRGGRRELLSPWRAFIEASRLNRLFPNHPYFRRLHQYEEESELGVVEVPTVSGAFMVMPKRSYDVLGGMDDNLFLHVDDADLCIRVLKAGGKVLYCGTIPIYHHLSTSNVSRSFVEWHKTRSSTYYFYKHFHDTYPAWVLTLTSLTLWIRFGLLAIRCLPRDLFWLLRRLVR